MKLHSILLVLLLSFGGLTAARAEGDQLFILAWAGPAGSISQAGQAQTAIYVRWDLVEGILPADVVRFRLYRGAARAMDVAVNSVKTADEILTLYAGAAQERRRNELIDALNRSRTAGEVTPVTVGNFHTVLSAKLAASVGGGAAQKEAMAFAHLMSRMDIDVAVARGRAYIESEPPAGTLTYRLVGVNADGAEVTLGTTTANRALRISPRAPVDLIQVRELGRCDAPDEALSHGTVALDWGHPGSGGAETLASAVQIAGYDVYRSTAACGPVVPPRDLRAEAALRAHDAAGRLTLAGLERVNDRPVMISGRPAPGPDGVRREHTAKGFNHAFSQFMESRDALETRGLHAGDPRCYYVVARDLAGNYGDTARVAVEVTNASTPPAPQAAEVFPFNADGDADDRLLIRWDHLDVPAFHREHGDRTYCNLETALASGRLTYVSRDEKCGTGESETYLNVDRYLVYRFDEQAQAQQFADSDGDGYSDTDERTVLPPTAGPLATFQTTAPGLACSPGASPPGAPNHRVAEIAVNPATLHALTTGRRVLEFSDTVPAQTGVAGEGKDNVYWYRIAAVGRNGRISELGPPVRGVFPLSAKPPRGDGPRVGICDYYTRVSERADLGGNGLAPARVGYHGLDTTEQASRVRFYCESPVFEGNRDDDVGLNVQPDRGVYDLLGELVGPIRRTYLAEMPLDVRLDERTTVGSLSQSQCGVIQETGANCLNLGAEFVAESGRILGTAVVPSDLASKCDFLVGLFKDCDQGFRPIRPGEAVDGPLVVPDPGAPACVDVNQELDGRTWRLDRVCPGEWPFVYSPPALGSELVCLTLTLHGENNVAGTDIEVPCVKMIGGPPAAPTLEGLTFAGSNGELTWRGPAQTIAGVFIEWSATAVDASNSDFFVADGDTGSDTPVVTTLALTAPPLSVPELWCVRARSVGTAPAPGTSSLSEWTSPLCVLRMPPGEVIPTYLPWPEIPLPGSKGSLLSTYLRTDGMPALAVGIVNAAVIAGGSANCSVMTQPNVCDIGGEATACINDVPLVGQCDALCGAIDSGMLGNNRFIVLRQERTAAGEPPTAWHQVSPLIERAFCSRFCDGQPVPKAWMSGPGQAPKGSFSVATGFAMANLGDENVVVDPGNKVAPQDPGADFAVRLRDRGQGRCFDFLDDPHVELVDMSAYGWSNRSLVYVDRFPHIAATEVRYTLVYFDERGEISGTRDTSFMAIP